MIPPKPPPEEVRRAGYETRDVDVPFVALIGLLLVVVGVSLHVILAGVHERLVPEAGVDGAAPPVEMPGEAPLTERIESVPRPRLDALEPLTAVPPSYRSSRPVPDPASPTVRPEDLRADRQPALQGYGWVDRGKVARIPIGRAMDAVVERSKAAKKGGGK